ncbi:MAG: hypothetical protein AAB467_00415 [Patescibacteria group bacterium]
MNKSKLIISSAAAAILSIIFVVVITIWAEFSAPLKGWLKNFSGHHWTSKSIFSVLLYSVATPIIYFLPCKHADTCLKRTLNLLLIAVALGVLALTLFFAEHYFKLI